MQYTAEHLEEIEKYAELLMPLRDIAILVDIDEDSLRHDCMTPGSQAYTAYHRGKLRTAVQLRAQEIDLAKSGAPQAVENASRLLTDMSVDEI